MFFFPLFCLPTLVPLFSPTFLLECWSHSIILLLPIMGVFDLFSLRNHYPKPPPEFELPPYDSNGAYGLREMVKPSDITPYLGFRSRMSQVWLNRWTVLLALTLARLLLATNSLDHDMASARREALSACTSVELMGSTMVSMPHYMAVGVNDLTATGVEKAVDGLREMLFMTITGAEELVVFFVGMMSQTYLCLISFAITGSLHAAVDIIGNATHFLNKTLGDVGKDIGHDVDSFTSSLDRFLKAFNNVGNFLTGKNKSPPKVDDSKWLHALDNVKLPSSLDADLRKLNNSIPTDMFKEVNQLTRNITRAPFEDVKKHLNQSLDSYTLDRSALPVPGRKQLSFCGKNDGINSFFNSIAAAIQTARKIYIAILVAAAVLACAPMAYHEMRAWCTMQNRARDIDGIPSKLDAVYIVSRPYSARFGRWVASAFVPGPRQQLVRWVIAYVSSPSALFVLSLALAGLSACACQAFLLRALSAEVPVLANKVGMFAGEVVDSLERSSAQWADATNGVIQHVGDELNDDIFGWVNTTTHAVNDTLNAFIDHSGHVLHKTFDGTVLYDPLKDVLHCLYGLKIASIQRGLTWVSDHAHLTLPQIPNNTFSLAASNMTDSSSSNPTSHLQLSRSSSSSSPSSFLSTPESSTTDAITAAVDRVLAEYARALVTEALIAAALAGVWVFVFLAGILRALSRLVGGTGRMMTTADGRAEHGREQYGPNAAAATPVSAVQSMALDGCGGNGGSGGVGSSRDPIGLGARFGGRFANFGSSLRVRDAPVPAYSEHDPAKTGRGFYGDGCNEGDDSDDVKKAEAESNLGYVPARPCEAVIAHDRHLSSYGQVEYVSDVKGGY